MSVKKVILAYSGGLDTSVMIKWLIERYNCDVVTYTANLGQNENLISIKEKALKIGAKKAYIEDLRMEFLKDYVMPSLKMGATYENKYPLATALGRPLITKKLIETAHKEKADAIAHGSTGKGNDQVRFDVSAAAIDSSIKILAPVRNWELKSRDAEIEYAEKHGISIPITKERPYSIDRNIWGVSIEAGSLEDTNTEPEESAYLFTKNPQDVEDKPRYITIEFKNGVPIAINEEKMDLVSLTEHLNKIAGSYGVGRIDMVENRLIGIKSREIYEAPAAVSLLEAKRSLDELILDRETLHLKDHLAIKYAEIVYYGYWFSMLREALDAFADKLNEYASGSVKLKFYKGKVNTVARTSNYSLYNRSLATYDPSDEFRQEYGEAFCYIWGLPLKVYGALKKEHK